MKPFKQRDSQLPSLKLLIITMALIILTIFIVLLTLRSSNTFFYILPVILTIASLIATSISLGGKNTSISIGRILSQLSHLKKRLPAFFSFLFQTLGILSSLITILIFLGIGTVFLGYTSQHLFITILGIAILLISISTFIGVYLTLKEITSLKTKVKILTEAKEEQARIEPILSNIALISPSEPEEVIVLRKEIVYEYLADGITLIQRKHLQLQALRNGINSYTDRYRWTGGGQCILKMLTPGFEIINQRKQGDPEWDYFDVKFPHPLHKEQIVEFTIEWELVDEKRTGISFLASTIDVETKYLSLQVILPPELEPTRAYTYEFANYIDTLPTETRVIRWSSATHSLNYEVLYPKKYHRYIIRWFYD